MRKAKVHVKGVKQVSLLRSLRVRSTRLNMWKVYNGPEVSRTVPVSDRVFTFDSFPSFLRDYCRKGSSWKGLLKTRKIDRADYFSQLMAVGNDMVGAVTVEGDPKNEPVSHFLMSHAGPAGTAAEG